MPRRPKPRVDQKVVDKAVAELSEILDLDSITDVDRFFVADLLSDYGKMAGIADAAWRSIYDNGLTQQRTTGTKNNRHNTMVKSEDLAIFKSAIASKTTLASRISKFAKSGAIQEIEEDDGFDSY